jgi:hypothetical protein
MLRGYQLLVAGAYNRQPGFQACRAVSRFLYPCGRQSFIWAVHYWTALATYPRVKRSGPLLLPYLVLLRVGFALPAGSLRPRCALTAPFHPYLVKRRFIFCGTFREIRFERIPPAVSRHAALWRPDFPPLVQERPPARQASAIMARFADILYLTLRILVCIGTF